MSPTGDSTLATLRRELAEARAERDAALARETATAEILQVINSSRGDLAPVFDTMLERALRLCEASLGVLWHYDGERFHAIAQRGGSRAFVDFVTRAPLALGPESGMGRVALGEPFVHFVDVTQAKHVQVPGVANTLVQVTGARTWLVVPLRKDDVTVGVFTIFRQEVRRFGDQQIALLQNFAAQTVIAMENARLITETREALDQQTATAEVLGVINASPGDLAPVFDAVLEKAMCQCGASFGELRVYEGDELFRTGAIRGVPTAFAEHRRQNAPPSGPNSLGARVLAGEGIIHIVDLKNDAAYREGDANRRSLVDLGGARSALAVALRQDEKVLGFITLYRQEVRAYADKQIALLQNFAAQAVIAMENARLITETREALEQQTAVSDVLQVISRSAFDLQPVLDTLVQTAGRLCDAEMTFLLRRDGDVYRAAAALGWTPEYRAFLEAHPIVPDRSTLTGRVVLEGRAIHIRDIKSDPEYALAEASTLGGARTQLGVPLMRDGATVGVIILSRQRVESFSERQIKLVTTFADQAVIAMENARLLGDLRERTEDLQQSLEYQTATSDVLKIISRSTFDLQPVLDTLVETAVRLCEGQMAFIYRRDGDLYHLVASFGFTPEYHAYMVSQPQRAGLGSMVGRVAMTARPVHIFDAANDPEYTWTEARKRGGYRTMLGVPLLREGEPIGLISIVRAIVKPFTDTQIELMTAFADQAGIAIENARLIGELREARDAAEAAFHDLQAAQSNLVQAQKMAALGQLTAGIAHEIKNPLNFVNNFASLSVELLDELKETAAPALTTLDVDKRADVDDTMELLTSNLEKIAEHGKRADNIVKSMLEHSRGVSGERREVDLNGVIEEALNLAYHGARAQDQSFNITLERDYAKGLEPIELAPQEITRVFLNLFGNGFYAASKRARDNGEGSFRPVLTVRTCEDGDAVEVLTDVR